MIKHLFKIVWNRKRANALIVLEIVISFLVLFGVTALCAYYLNNYRQPLGFDYENVWNISIDLNQRSDNTWSPEQVETVRQLYLALGEFDEIESAAGAMYAPYWLGGSFTGFGFNGRNIEYEIDEVTDDFAKVMNIKLLRGRWFSKSDDGADWSPVVINEKLSEDRFGAEDPLGRDMDPSASRRQRVVGVVRDFRKNGEFAAPINFLFVRKKLDDPQNRPPRNLLLKVRPGTTAALEEKMIPKLQAIARDWSFDVSPIERLRATRLKQYLGLMIVAGLVAGFLMLMVGMGLTGVLWQNVTQRRKEIGLRRATGATAARIHQQILGELFVLTTIALLIGLGIVFQLPLLLTYLGLTFNGIFIYSLITSCLIVYVLTALCGLYPSSLATHVHPSEALHYE